MRARLIGATLLLAAFVLLVVELPLGLTYAGRQEDRLVADVERDARVLAGLVEEQVEAGDTAAVAATAGAYAERSGARVVITDDAGISLVDTGAAPTGRDFSTRPEFEAALAGRQLAGIRTSRTLGQELAYVAVPITSGLQVAGAVRVSFPTDRLREQVRENWMRLGLLSLLVLAAAASLGWLLATWAVAPVATLEEAAGRLAGGDLSARAPVDRGPPELRRLAASFDDMADRLESLLASQRAFVADASHQLRTPLTALRLRLDGLEHLLVDAADAPGGAVPEEAARAELEAVTAEVDRLGRLVEGLLALARAERGRAASAPAGDGPGVPGPVAVGRLVAEAGDRWSALADERGVGLRVDVRTELRAAAVPGALEQILDNLLDNALEVAPIGTDIDLTVRAGDDAATGAVVTVRDRGPGLPDEERARATDRFWRGPGAEPGGTGLGLAIVDELARAGGGSFTLDRPADGPGLEARVRLAPAPSVGGGRLGPVEHREGQDAGPDAEDPGDERPAPVLGERVLDPEDRVE